VDADGFVFFRERLKRIVKISGVAVFPSEIEDAAAGLPFVARACAVGFAREKSGAAIRLHVELKDGVSESEAVKEQILAHLKIRVIKWAVPREIVFVKQLPLTMIGKVDYKQLEGKA
jgi:long-chain acyl-CoA synthetase